MKLLLEKCTWASQNASESLSSQASQYISIFVVLVALTSKCQDFVPNVDCGIMLATVQRVLSPGAQEPFHIDREDVLKNGFKERTDMDISVRTRRYAQAMRVAGNFHMSGSLPYFEPNSGPCVPVMAEG